MMRILAILGTALISGLTAVGAFMILQMPASAVGLGMALLGCAILMAVICAGLIIQGIPRRRTTEHSAALIASGGAPAMHAAPKPKKSSHSAAAKHSSKSRTQSREDAPRRPNRLRAETRAAENLLNMGPQDSSSTPDGNP